MCHPMWSFGLPLLSVQPCISYQLWNNSFCSAGHINQSAQNSFSSSIYLMRFLEWKVWGLLCLCCAVHMVVVMVVVAVEVVAAATAVRNNAVFWYVLWRRRFGKLVWLVLVVEWVKMIAFIQIKYEQWLWQAWAHPMGGKGLSRCCPPPPPNRSKF
jgi:hypothetical protein